MVTMGRRAVPEEVKQEAKYAACFREFARSPLVVEIITKNRYFCVQVFAGGFFFDPLRLRFVEIESVIDFKMPKRCVCLSIQQSSNQ